MTAPTATYQPPTPQESEDNSAAQKKLALVAALAVVRLWNTTNMANMDLSWPLRVPDALDYVTMAQARAVDNGATYIANVLKRQGVIAPPAGSVISSALSGVVSDGRSLEGLLLEAPIVAKKAILAGKTPDVAKQTAAVWLDMAVRTQVADAGRGGESIAIVARVKVGGYVRMLNPPSCSRCIMLAGKWFKWNHGFERHPRCDCIHIPVSEDVAGDYTTNPRTYFDSLTQPEQDRLFGKAGAAAIRDGSDISRVVNARRGMNVATGTTKEAARKGTRRLMPERIYAMAKGDRQEAIRLLRSNGYIR